MIARLVGWAPMSAVLMTGRLRASGAIPIDARQPLSCVADEILARTLPRHA
jgi:hypothetical protein